MFGFSPIAIVIILVIVFLIFGAGKLPDIGSGVGKALKNFKNSLSGKDEIDVTPEEEPAPKKRQITGSKTAAASKGKKPAKSKTAKRA
ncbi:MAG: twin-arginine translocase TatA/TatE family subunit [Deltaproteobacteria bacterium]|jgi:sec-independent protein translocase protein TatA|nr:twin-arginine translocase TatA/TatE family subunit [Deltaproteobacteria bacterium]MCL5880596.1 twin-arginine translocase TatA/TatE family subunit [Deltaproteobacteria bacterium]MDA8304893.1 twin-arginine translocase TatA/TatE family subunit [Deltaproteobacteria bacterium]